MLNLPRSKIRIFQKFFFFLFLWLDRKIEKEREEEEEEEEEGEEEEKEEEEVEKEEEEKEACMWFLTMEKRVSTVETQWNNVKSLLFTQVIKTILQLHSDWISVLTQRTKVVHIQWRLAIPEVKGPTNFFCYWRIFVIANIENKKEWLGGTKV